MGNSPKTKVEEIINIVKIASIFILFFWAKVINNAHINTKTTQLKDKNTFIRKPAPEYQQGSGMPEV